MQKPDHKSLIIFDLDGTLIDSAPDLATAVNRMLTKLNMAAAPIATVKSWVGNGSLKLTERALAYSGEIAADTVSLKDKLQTAHELFLAEYADCTTLDTAPYAGVSDGLARLQAAGFKLAICTNKPERFLPSILAHFNWQQYFEIVLGGDSLAVKKPDPTPLLHICERLGVTPAAAIMVGDSKNDILAGQAADITTLALRYGYNYGEPIDEMNPDAAFDGFSELTDYILANYHA